MDTIVVLKYSNNGMREKKANSNAVCPALKVHQT
jgi:hypothetical protein